MGCVPFPNGAELNLQFEQDNQLIENTFAVDCGAPPTATVLTNLAAAMLTWENTDYRVLRHNSSFCTGVYARDMACPTGVSIEQVLATPEAGTVAGSASPNNVTIAIKAQTGLAGRSFRGRSYIVGIPDNFISLDRNGIAVAHLADYVSAFQALIPAIATVAGCHLAVASRRHNGADRTTGVLTRVTNYSFSDTFLDSQRRRLPGHNRHR